ncbi:MAG: DNA repair protein RecN [Erysipelotrichaceae bacterium]|nr:DNA repair protein RecN [Erysipelotrichaceae bacterium]
MLEKLYIKNFVIIDELEIDFNKGFNVFTGETGAGKSIIVDALSYIAGNRIDKNIVKKGQDKCKIEAYFTLNETFIQLLSDEDIEYDDYLIVSRVINSDNKSINKVNGTNVTLNFLKSLFESYLDIHSQKDSQYLLNSKNHMILLDNYANNKELLKQLDYTYNEYHSLINEKERALNEQFNKDDLELLEHEIDEIIKADLSEDEENNLLKEEKSFKNAQKIIENLTNAIELFDKEGGIDELLHQYLQALRIEDEYIKGYYHKIKDTYYNLIEDASDIKKYFNKLDFSEAKINEVEERLFIYNKIKRKYGGSILAVNKYLRNGQNKLNIALNRQNFIDEIDGKIAIAYDKYLKVADNISRIRIAKAQQLETLIIKELRDLELPNALFKIAINKADDSRFGYDNIEFMISMNKGENLNPLIKVASGGELSRILLGLKTIFTKLMGIQTVIFDEIDIGVSGKASSAIGLKMASIAKDSQIFSITHSAQVASFASNHYLVKKNIIDGRTCSNISLLNDEERINELAIMQSSMINDISIKAAKQLLEESRRIYGSK